MEKETNLLKFSQNKRFVNYIKPAIKNLDFQCISMQEPSSMKGKPKVILKKKIINKFAF